MSDKNKIVLLFPDGVGIRNYLYSNVFKHSTSELILFHSFDKETEKEILKETGISHAIQIPTYKESFLEKFYRELICLARLHYNSKQTKNPTILTNWNTEHKGFFKKAFYGVIEHIAPLIKSYDTILTLEKRYQKSLQKNIFYKQVQALFKEINPNLVFCSHQRALQAATVFEVAKKLKITTTTVIFSWDNLPKARMALRADNYLVWSAYMKKEVQLYYPEISESAIHITGTPQFEFYNHSEFIIEKSDFYKKYDLDFDKKIICFSGDDVKTSPDDPKYLKDLAEEIIKAGKQNEYQILLRRCPVDLSDRYSDVIAQYSALIKEATPLWVFKKSKSWTSVYPSFSDVSLLTSTVYYSDIVINVGSTMAFDFSMFNKPCVFINYDQPNKKVKDWSVNTIYQYQHFKSMPNKEAVFWWNKKEEIMDVFSKKWNKQAMIDWKNIVVSNPDNVAQEIQKILKLN